jgi:hypothetical protein
VDPGQYIIICWNKDHDKSTPVHSFTVEQIGAADDRPPKEDVVMKLFDYRFELDRALHKGVQVIRVETPVPVRAFNVTALLSRAAGRIRRGRLSKKKLACELVL